MNSLHTIISLIAPSSKPTENINYLPFNEPLYSENCLLFAQEEKLFQEEYAKIDKKILWIVRGGYGCSRFQDFDFHQKTLIGYSDLTYLFLRNFSLKNKIHGPSFCDQFLAKNSQNFDILKNILTIPNYTWNIPLKDHPKNLKITGKIVGGNLTLVSTLAGIMPPNIFDNKILLLEDTGEAFYKVHRYLVQLQKAGYFNNLKGVIKGTFLSLNQQQKNEISEEGYEEIFQEFFSEIPLFFTDYIGHGYDNIPFLYDHEIVIENSQITLNNSKFFL